MSAESSAKPTRPPLHLGVDLGSTAVHAALLDADGQLLWAASRVTAGRSLDALRALLRELPADYRGLPAHLALTGDGRELLSRAFGTGRSINEVVATARGAGALVPGTRGVIEIGGHMSRYVLLDPETGDLDDFALSELCAAGAGVFLEQQAGRLHLTIEQLAALAERAPRAATVAGRCAVFAKSDMIHLQQNGTPTDEIAYGLCVALARSFLASVLRGRKVAKPAALVGGAARNAGLVRALHEVLRLGPDELVVPEQHAEAGAVGAALMGAEEARNAGDSPVPLSELVDRLDRDVAGTALLRFDPLPDPGVPEPAPEPQGEGVEPGTPLVLGVDVGSVSTNLVLVTQEGELVDACYLATRGKPLDVLGEGLRILQSHHPGGMNIVGVATTGSGRHLAGRFLGADLVRNEITAQLRSAAEVVPELDTVIEIGGQDSKYIYAENGHIVDFTMNKVCAAGTGSFLEEQAQRLGISIIGEFAELALRAEAPVDLGSRCTVFMDNELAHALQAGARTEDLTAGLALSVARNYIEKVVAGRPIGDHVLFQGGTASNRAVVAAFRQLLKRPIHVHPYNRVSGAIGAALLLLDARRAGELPETTSFRGVEACQGELLGSFECKLCANRCQVNRYRSGKQIFFFGDVCERYSARGTRRAGPSDDHSLALRHRWLLEAAGLPPDGKPPKALPERPLGIPMISQGFHVLPVWTELARAAGYEPVLSGESTPAVLARAQSELRADTCLPIKMVFGHVQSLRKRGVRDILLPSVVSLPPQHGRQESALTCPFTRHYPYMLRQADPEGLVVPELDLAAPPGRRLLNAEEVARQLGAEPEALQAAVDRGVTAIHQWQARLRLRGREILERVADRAIVVIGRPYNLGDAFLNMNLGSHLEHLEIPFLTLDELPLDQVVLGPEWDDLPWASNRDYVKAALLIRDDPRLFPLVLSSFGCMPDGFTIKHLDVLLADRPRLFLELDEHRGEAGFVTRLEAFADEIAAHLRRSEPEERPELDWRPRRDPSRKGRYLLPYFGDNAWAFYGALQRGDREVVLLPEPDEESRLLGEAFSSGRECHPFTLLTGDLVRAVQDGTARPGDSYFFPGGLTGCVFSQYVDGLRHALRRLGGQGIEVAAPKFDELKAALGIRAGLHLWRGLVASNLLQRARFRFRPYEVEKGSVDRAYRAQLPRLAEAVREGEVLEFLPEALEAIRAVPRRDGPRRPVVGVAGDIYTRINSFGNGELFDRLEALGCEVWPSPYLTDNTEFNISRRLREAVEVRDVELLLGQGFLASLRDFDRLVLRHVLPDWAREFREPTYDEVIEWTAPYLGRSAEFLVTLNLAKMVQFAREGASGVVNAICFGCMMGSVAGVIMERIRRDHGGIPMTVLTFGGTDGTDGSARLEAFVHQVHRYHQRRLEREQREEPPGFPVSLHLPDPLQSALRRLRGLAAPGERPSPRA